MTDRERYKRAFSVLHAPEELDLEVTEMKKTTKRHISKAAAVIAAIITIFIGSAVAYASNIGGIQRQVQIWLYGDQTDAVLEIEQNDHTEYSLTFEDENGEKHERHGGGVAFDMFGNEIPLTEEDIMEHLSEPEVMREEDGTMYVYCRDQKVDITDKFDENGVCYVQVTADKTYYITVTLEEGGYSCTISLDKYEEPDWQSADHEYTTSMYIREDVSE